MAPGYRDQMATAGEEVLALVVFGAERSTWTRELETRLRGY